MSILYLQEIMQMNRIRELRQEHQLTQDDLGKLVGKTNHTISKWESEVNELGSSEIILLCNVLLTTSDYLLGRTDFNGFDPTKNFISFSSHDQAKTLIYLLNEYIKKNKGLSIELVQEVLSIISRANIVVSS